MNLRSRVDVGAVVAGIASGLVSMNVGAAFALYPALEARFPAAAAEGPAWVLAAYAIVFACLLQPAARWAAELGRKRTLKWGLGAFALASALCASAEGLPSLVALRVAQAAAAALLASTGSRWSLPGAALGLAAGACAVEAGGWPWAFWISVPMAVPAWVAAHFVMADVQQRAALPRPDVAQPLLLATAAGLMVLAVLWSGDWGWSAPGTVMGLFQGCVMLALVWVRSVDRPGAVLDLNLFDEPRWRWRGGAALVLGAAAGALILVGFAYLTQVRGYGLARAGCLMATVPLLAAYARRPWPRTGHAGLLRAIAHLGLALGVAAVAAHRVSKADASMKIPHATCRQGAVHAQILALSASPSTRSDQQARTCKTKSQDSSAWV